MHVCIYTNKAVPTSTANTSNVAPEAKSLRRYYIATKEYLVR